MQGKNVKASDETRNFYKLLEQDSWIHALTFFIHESARLTFKVFKQFQEKPSSNNNHNNHHHQRHKGLICSNQTLTEEINKKTALWIKEIHIGLILSTTFNFVFNYTVGCISWQRNRKENFVNDDQMPKWRLFVDWWTERQRGKNPRQAKAKIISKAPGGFSLCQTWSLSWPHSLSATFETE